MSTGSTVYITFRLYRWRTDRFIQYHICVWPNQLNIHLFSNINLSVLIPPGCCDAQDSSSRIPGSTFARISQLLFVRFHSAVKQSADSHINNWLMFWRHLIRPLFAALMTGCTRRPLGPGPSETSLFKNVHGSRARRLGILEWCLVITPW